MAIKIGPPRKKKFISKKEPEQISNSKVEEIRMRLFGYWNEIFSRNDPQLVEDLEFLLNEREGKKEKSITGSNRITQNLEKIKNLW